MAFLFIFRCYDQTCTNKRNNFENVEGYRWFKQCSPRRNLRNVYHRILKFGVAGTWWFCRQLCKANNMRHPNSWWWIVTTGQQIKLHVSSRHFQQVTNEIIPQENIAILNESIRKCILRKMMTQFDFKSI